VVRRLRADDGDQLRDGRPRVVGGLGGPVTGLLDGEVGLDLRLARQGAELRDGGTGLGDGEVTGADSGQEGGLGALCDRAALSDGELAVLLHGLGGGHADSFGGRDGGIWGSCWEAAGEAARAEPCSRT